MRHKRTRSIARLDIKNDYVIKGIHLEGLRKVGKPKELVKHYYNEGINEIFLNDCVATLYGRNNLFFLIKEISKFCFIPITVGGGLRNIDDIKEALNSGADKVYVNSALVRNPKLINKIIENYGSSTLVAGVDCKYINNQKWKVLIENGREETGLDVIEWVMKLCECGVGEIIITSIDKEGTKKGFDIELIKSIDKISTVPIIVSGGCGTINHILELNKIGPEAVAFASVLHYDILKISDINENMI
jgi:cyclase